jgi:ABC-type nitrate/sulfonate/bicarbonate transport system substrate-binding protein
VVLRRAHDPSSTIRRLTLLVATAITALANGCGAGPASGDTVNVVVGYQSKAINTVTAGTLLRSRGYFEQRLWELGQRTGKSYSVAWQDYDTGAPITAQMIADKIDIGSIGDYPLQQPDRSRSQSPEIPAAADARSQTAALCPSDQRWPRLRPEPGASGNPRTPANRYRSSALAVKT